jgi:hypothetical protein
VLLGHVQFALLLEPRASVPPTQGLELGPVYGELLRETSLRRDGAGHSGLLVLGAGRRRRGNLSPLVCRVEAVRLRKEQVTRTGVMGAHRLQWWWFAGVGRSSGGGNEVIESFVGIRSKCYTFKTKNNVVKKAKGVNKVVVKKNISFDDDKNCVLKDEPKSVKINAIRTVKMMNYSLTQNKLALSNKDDKRVWKNTTSTAWGHWRNLGSAPNEQ